MYIYICIWKNSLFLEKRFLVYIQIKFLCLPCKYSTFVPFYRSIRTKKIIIFSTEASLKRLFYNCFFWKIEKYFDSNKFFLQVKEWQQSQDEYSKKFYRWSYNLTTISSLEFAKERYINLVTGNASNPKKIENIC